MTAPTAEQPDHASEWQTTRPDGIEKVTGRARFANDLTLPGMLHCALVRSTVPHARVLDVDASAAEAVDGVATVLTGADLADLTPYFGNIVLDRPLLALDRVRFAGEPLAAVAAESRDLAAGAARLVAVELDPLPAATALDEALAEGAPRLHEGPYPSGGLSGMTVAADYARNVCHEAVRERGDVEAGLAAADRVFDDTYAFPAVYQYALEPHVAMADFDGGVLRVWTSAQHPFAVRFELARVFGLPLHRVQVVVPYLGGGFGSKSWTKLEPLVAAVARKAGRPVKLALTVPGAMATSRRHNARVRVRTGVRADGRVVARDVDVLLDTGAYTDNGPRVADSSLDAAIAPYDLPAYRARSRAVFTNTVPAGSMRAIGSTQVSWACELQLDEIAHALGLSPVELRLANVARRGATIFEGLKEADADVPGDLRRLAAEVGEPGPLPDRGDGRLRGRGLAVAMTGAGASPAATALVRLHADGSVSVLAGSSELGQGSRTVLSSIVATELGLPAEQVRFVPTDTDYTTYDYSTGASRTTIVMGHAVQAAAADVVAQLRGIASARAEGADVELEDGRACWPGGEASYGDLVCWFFGASGGELIGRGYTGRRVPGSPLTASPLYWEVALGAAEIAVDPETGELEVERYVALADAGRALVPGAVKGQEIGAVTMGLGSTLREELRIRDGLIENESLLDYTVPTCRDVPASFTSILVENGDGPGPSGSRGVAEASVVPVGGAVCAALLWATGRAPRELPLTPARVAALLSG